MNKTGRKWEVMDEELFMKEKLYIAIFTVGILLTTAIGIFSLIMEVRMPSGYLRANEEYRDMKLLGDLSRQLLDFRREGLNYLIQREELYLNEFQSSRQVLLETLQIVERERTGLGDPAVLEAVEAEINRYIQDFEQIVSGAQTLEAEAVLQEIRGLVGTGRLDRILDEIVTLDQQNYLVYVRESSEVSEAARRALLAITLFEIAALGLLVFSAVMLLRVNARNKQLLRQEEMLKEQLKAKNQELESFIRIAGHDLRAPLVNIRGFTDEILEHNRQLNALRDSLPLSTDQSAKAETILQRDMPEAIHYITASAETLGCLIQGMVTAAKAGQLPVHPVVIDAAALLADIVRDFDFRLKEAGGQVRVEELPPCTADHDQIRQVFSNLIDNAIKYRQPSRPLEIRVKGYTQSGQSIYRVEDNGIGIGADEIDSIFNLYHQLKRKEMTGEGIGLATVKRMVEHNGGSVDAESEPGEGSRFTVRLPAG